MTESHIDYYQRSNGTVRICESVLYFIESEAAKAGKYETGGIIAGNGSFEESNIVITRASSSGPKAVKKRNFFSRDVFYCQRLLDQWAIMSKGKTDYLGEWHKHFEEKPHPSPLDLDTINRIAFDGNYHINRPILLIIGSSNHRDSLSSFFIGSLGIEEIKWQIEKNNNTSGNDDYASFASIKM